MSVKPKKSLGQNFLYDKNVIEKIIKASDIKSNDIVLEIGPGSGNLTEITLIQEKESQEEDAKVFSEKEISVTKYENPDGSFRTETLTIDRTNLSEHSVASWRIDTRIRETITNNIDGSVVKEKLLEKFFFLSQIQWLD